jgi:DNA-directed RNA polymerase subunit RPC12/RpoP
MFTCERCGKEFTEKRNLTRHKKTHLKDPTVSGQTYSRGRCRRCQRDILYAGRVSIDDIGDHMKTYAEERGIMNQKRKCLIGSMYGEKIMVILPLLK